MGRGVCAVTGAGSARIASSAAVTFFIDPSPPGFPTHRAMSRWCQAANRLWAAANDSFAKDSPMPLSLHAALIPSWLQILGAGRGWLDKATAHGMGEAELADARLIEDMFPFAYQVKSMAVHSQGAIEAVRQGVFSPNFGEALPSSLTVLRARFDVAIALLVSVGEHELVEFHVRPLRFEIGEKLIDF